MLIHTRTPPGVETMNRLQDKIRYSAENTAHGARMRIATHDRQALVRGPPVLSFSDTRSPDW